MAANIQSYIIKLEALEKEYMVILKQYEENYSNYINNLKATKENNSSDFVSLQGRTYWGEFGLKETALQTIEECESMCASDLKCTGATFNPAKRYCWTRGGNGNLTSGTSNDYAIIPKIRQDLIILKNLNQKLIFINTEINETLNQIYPIAQKDVVLKNQKQERLEKYYQLLLNEQIELEKTLQEYETITEQYDNNFINTVSQNTSLRLWSIISLIIIVATVKQLSGVNSGAATSITWLIIIVLILYYIYVYLNG